MHEFMNVKMRPDGRARTSREVAHYLLSALSKANEMVWFDQRSIFHFLLFDPSLKQLDLLLSAFSIQVLKSGHEEKDPRSAGTTTCLCGVVVALQEHKSQANLPPYAFIGAGMALSCLCAVLSCLYLLFFCEYTR